MSVSCFFYVCTCLSVSGCLALCVSVRLGVRVSVSVYVWLYLCMYGIMDER